MKKTHHETVLRKLIMLSAALALILGLPFAFATRAFASPTPKFAYVANACVSTSDCSAGNVSAYTINSSTGALRAVAGSPFAAGSYPRSVTVDPSGRFAYVTNENDNTVSAYAINSSTGALRAVAGSPFSAGDYPYSVTVDPSGRFAYVTNSNCPSIFRCPPSNVSAYTINSSTGALSAIAGSPFAAGKNPISVTVDPSGRFAYVANDGNSVSAYTINSSTGALRAVAGSPFAAGYTPVSVTVDPSGRFVYVANLGGSTVSAYTINSSTGALRAVAGSPFATANGPTSVTVDPSGQFAYVVDTGVSAYTINSSTGALHAVAGSPFAAGSYPSSVAIAGQAVMASVLTLSPRSLDYGKLPINTSSAAQSVTVTNNSAKTVAITGITLRGTAPGQFTIADDCGKSLAAYRTCTLEATFSPTTRGAKAAFLDVNGGGGGRSVQLTGTGT